MPTIDIREVDISTVNTADVTTNTVYVPGYAVQGPANEPTLCNSLEEFQRIFGTQPYKFQNGGNVESGYVYKWEEGQVEPSYVYASDLLRLGLPVLFERMGGSAYASYTSSTSSGVMTVGVTAKYPGASYGNVYFKMEPLADYAGSCGKITVWRVADEATGSTELSPVETRFTFDPTFHRENQDYILWDIGADKKNADRSGLVTVSFTRSVDTDVVPTIGGSSGQQLTYTPAGADFTPSVMYSFFASGQLDNLKDKNEYVIKFITSGGYPTFFPGLGTTHTYADYILDVATNRRDVTALIDYNVETESTFAKPASELLEKVTTWVSGLSSIGTPAEDAGNYGAMFTPWGTFESPTLSGLQIKLAPSFAYLSALATSTQTYANWYAVAGVTRGYVPHLIGVGYRISDSVGNDLQPTNNVSINPIQLIRPYGYRIWGSRTLRNNRKYGPGEDTLMATSFLNVRQLANDIKRTVYVASKDCMFEPDDDVLWINFKSKITPLLDQMKGNRGLTEYTMRRVKADKKATLKAVITAYVIDPVEHFDITLELSDDQVSVTE